MGSVPQVPCSLFWSGVFYSCRITLRANRSASPALPLPRVVFSLQSLAHACLSGFRNCSFRTAFWKRDCDFPECKNTDFFRFCNLELKDFEHFYRKKVPALPGVKSQLSSVCPVFEIPAFLRSPSAEITGSFRSRIREFTAFFRCDRCEMTGESKKAPSPGRSEAGHVFPARRVESCGTGKEYWKNTENSGSKSV